MVRTIIWADKKYNNMPIVYSFEGKSDNSAEKKIGEFPCNIFVLCNIFRSTRRNGIKTFAET